MGSKEGMTLQQRALAALERSTMMLKVASLLRKQGNKVEAEKLVGEAREQRTISTLLMAKHLERSVRTQPHNMSAELRR